MNDIEIGDEVVANRDIPRTFVSKGDIYTVVAIECVDSELYFDISNEDSYVVLSSSNCWNKVDKTISV